MVVVPAGRFVMGSSAQEVARDLEDAAKYDKPRAVQGYLDFERPSHPVSIDASFAVGKHLVINPIAVS
jgi:formylglycine-generating enzyme required for sulfatase activity